MSRRSVVFAAPRRVEVHEDDIPYPGEGEVLVRALVSAISAGTELHFFRGTVAEGMVLDETLPGLEGRFRYPASYGYASVGEIVGDGRRVFGFQPHTSHYVVSEAELYELPDSVSNERGALWPSFETAVNLVLDARPLVGERVLVVGQGVVGLSVTSLLSRFPLGEICTVDPLERRRESSLRCGAGRALDTDQAARLEDFDVSFELSGRTEGLALAVKATGFEGRVVVGSWYGDEPAPVELGTHFHRARLTIVSSQVSHIGSALTSRWNKSRRMEVAVKALEHLPMESIVTHRFPVERASEAYALLDAQPDACLQVMLTY